MWRYIAQWILLVCIINNVLAEGPTNKLNPYAGGPPEKPAKSPAKSPDQSPDRSPDQSSDQSPDSVMEAAIQAFAPVAPGREGREERISVSEYREHAGDKYQEYIDALEPKLDRIVELLKEPIYAYKFIEAKGIEAVIARHIVEYSASFRTKILNVILQLFAVAPKATSKALPLQVLDNILEIFEDEDALAVKGLVVDILYSWLPGNVRAQARVMKTKGLDAFYDQMHKLDASTVETKLKLFSKLLKEHIRARAEAKQDTKTEIAKLNLYKKMGLVERISTARVCIGLMNIFTMLVPTEKPYIAPIIDLLIEVQPYCALHFVKQTKAAQFFRVLEKHVKEMTEDTKQHYKKQGFNVTEIDEVVGKYVEAMKHSREEF